MACWLQHGPILAGGGCLWSARAVARGAAGGGGAKLTGVWGWPRDVRRACGGSVTFMRQPPRDGHVTAMQHVTCL
eukprot:292519-Chlamydomonas_euryale.AAC.2